VLWNRHGFRIGKLVLLDELIGVRDVVRFERRNTHQKGVKDHSYAPDIDFIAVSMTQDDFWCDVIGSAADASFLLILELHASGQSEVPELDIKLLAEEYIAELEIAMQNFSAVQVCHSLDNLHNESLRLRNGETLTLAYKLIETLSATD